MAKPCDPNALCATTGPGLPANNSEVVSDCEGVRTGGASSKKLWSRKMGEINQLGIDKDLDSWVMASFRKMMSKGVLNLQN